MKINQINSDTQVANHILPSSANLLGVCFLIFSLVSTVGKPKETLLDELAIAGVFIFLGSSLFSYLSLRVQGRNVLLERIADCIFIFGLVLLTFASLIIAFKVNS